MCFSVHNGTVINASEAAVTLEPRVHIVVQASHSFEPIIIHYIQNWDAKLQPCIATAKVLFRMMDQSCIKFIWKPWNKTYGDGSNFAGLKRRK